MANRNVVDLQICYYMLGLFGVHLCFSLTTGGRAPNSFANMLFDQRFLFQVFFRFFSLTTWLFLLLRFFPPKRVTPNVSSPRPSRGRAGSRIDGWVISKRWSPGKQVAQSGDV